MLKKKKQKTKKCKPLWDRERERERGSEDDMTERSPRRLRGHKATATCCIASRDRPGLVVTSGEVNSLSIFFFLFWLLRIWKMHRNSNMESYSGETYITIWLYLSWAFHLLGELKVCGEVKLIVNKKRKRLTILLIT
jgi:hypothetical protein